jgi:hypothetical protein
MATVKRNELIHRLLAGRCELCGGSAGLQVHHIRKLADLNKPGRSERPPWVHLMAMRKRKTLVACETCHQESTPDGPQPSPGNEHWRAVCVERRPYRSGRGRRNRTRTTGTSPAAYFTRRAGLETEHADHGHRVAHPSGKPAEHRPRDLPVSHCHRASSRPNHPPDSASTSHNSLRAGSGPPLYRKNISPVRILSRMYLKYGLPPFDRSRLSIAG